MSRQPFVRSCSTTNDPRKPAPPVTTTRLSAQNDIATSLPDFLQGVHVRRQDPHPPSYLPVPRIGPSAPIPDPVWPCSRRRSGGPPRWDDSTLCRSSRVSA